MITPPTMKSETQSRPLRPPELLAPVQDFTNLTCAVDNGCDAVYFGLQQLNMRRAARNFAVADLPEIAARCGAAGVRRYLTMNVAIFDRELGVVDELLATAKPYIDAVVCCDPAVILACRRQGVPFHISTQASVANRAAAEFYRSLGAERIVLARECTLEEAAAIRRQVDIELETFVHGAMCVSWSGRCFLSQFSDGKSGNRGECRQNCRRQYRIVDETDPEQEFILEANAVLSAKDLCTMPFIEQLIEAGIDSFKIEGRNRNPQYVAETVGCYRRAVDAYFAGELDDELKNRLMGRLRQVYNREFSSGFFHGRPIAEFTRVNGSRAELQKRFVGIVQNHYAKAGVAEINVQDNVFQVGDTLAIEGPTSGLVQFAVRQVRQDELPVQQVRRGVATVAVPAKVRLNDRVFRLDRRTSFNNGR